MSSILEALRELEGERPPAARREIPPPESPRTARRALGAFIPVLGGLAVGMVVFGLWMWGPRLVVAPAPAPPPQGVPASDAAPAEPATTERPNWLDTAEPPRARVNRGTTATATSERATAAPARRSTDATPPAEPAAAPAPEPAPSGGQVSVESINYSGNVGERVVTLRFHGRRVTLRQRETIGDLEVQLIMPNGIYVQRGTEVYLLPLTR